MLWVEIKWVGGWVGGWVTLLIRTWVMSVSCNGVAHSVGGWVGGWVTLLTKTWVMSVLVVVPSPAMESLLLATALMSLAPTCMAGSGRLISLF